MAATSMGERLSEKRYDLIIPLPLHKARERERRFNQSEIIARRLSESLGVMLNADILIRIKATHQQAKLAENDRWNNVADAFVIAGGSREILAGKNVLLVDDIVTTGATIYEASRSLLDSGIRSIDIF
jgi:competence protein ComFC